MHIKNVIFDATSIEALECDVMRIGIVYADDISTAPSDYKQIELKFLLDRDGHVNKHEFVNGLIKIARAIEQDAS